MSAIWLPPLNSHENYKTIISAAQFKEATYDPSLSEKIFLIQVNFDVNFYSISHDMVLKGLSLSKYFSFSCRSLTSSQTQAKTLTSYMLCDMHIPFQLDHIFFRYRYLKAYGSTGCFKFLPEDGDSWIAKLQRFLAAVQRPRTVQELLDEVNLKFKPADESSLSALEDAKLDNDCSSTMQCLICLEDLAVGSKASSLPCSHVFHKTCITKWLQESNMCPLCRFKLPSV